MFPYSDYVGICRNEDVADGKRKRLRPGKISPCRPVPDHILRPPYVGSRQPPGIASGPEVHDEKGIECMRASGKLAAQVLEFAGTLVKVYYLYCYIFHLLESELTWLQIRRNNRKRLYLTKSWWVTK